jgi:hypothetical protein
MKAIDPRLALLTLLVALGPAPAQEEEPGGPGIGEDQLLAIVRKTMAAASTRSTVTGDVDSARAPLHVRAVVRSVRRMRLSVSFQDSTAREAIDFLRTVTRLSFVLSAKARTALTEEKPTVSMDVQNFPLEDILQLLALQLGEYRFTIRSGAIVLLRAEEYRPRKILRVYNVRRILTPPRDFPAPALGASLRAPDE